MPYKDPIKRREYQKKYWKKSYQEKRKHYIQKTKEYKEKIKIWYHEYKKQFKCKYCPENDPRCIDFDHKDPSKKRDNVATLAGEGFSIETIKKEIKKCIPTCSNCHRKRTIKYKY